MTDTSESTGLDSGPTVSIAIFLCVVGASAFLILPLIVGAAAESLQLVESQQGALAAVLMGGAAISALLAIFLVRRFNWRYLSAITVLIMLTGNFAALYLQPEFVFFLFALFVVSIGGGATYSLALTVLSDNSKPDRVFGYSIAAQVSFQVLGLLLLPGWIETGGIGVVLKFLIFINVSGLALVCFLPVSGKQHTLANPFTVFTQGRVVLALAGCFFFFFNVGCFWAFIERMGNAAGFAPQVIGNSLAAGVSVGIVGSLTASWLGDRHGRIQPLIIATVGTVISALLLILSERLVSFVVAIAVYNYVWNYSLAYQYAVVSSVDASGRGIAVTPAFHALGATVGPAIAGMIITANNFTGLNVLVMLSVIISLLLFLPAARRQTL